MNAISLYRLERWLFVNNIPIMPILIRNIIFLIYNSYIPPSAEIGEKSVFAYGGISVVLHSDSKIGKGCVIGQGVTVGAAEGYFSKKTHLSPAIGNNCYISAGAKILGNIRIGDNCIIGAGAIVLSDIPDNSVVVGCPGKVIKSTPSHYTAIED